MMKRRNASMMVGFNLHSIMFCIRETKFVAVLEFASNSLFVEIDRATSLSWK